MKQITISDAQRATSPNSIILVCVKKPDNSINLATVSWWTYLSNHPSMLGFSISNKGYTKKLLTANKSFIISIPDAGIADKVMHCGRTSGRDIDKVVEFKIDMTDDGFPVSSKLVFKCQVESTTNVGDHTFFSCTIDDILYNSDSKQLYSFDGYSRLAPLD